MAVGRVFVAVALFVLLGGGLWWTASQAPQGGDVVVGDFPVYVVADGEVVANGTVHAPGTPFEVLRALAGRLGLTLTVEQQTWIGGGCTATYVAGIGERRETASGGWNYYVRNDGGDWTWKPDGAACLALRPGDEVEWCWVEADSCRTHAP